MRHALTQPRTLDPESQAWIERLGARGRERDEALRELHALLLRAARFALAEKHTLLPQLGREGMDELAIEAADDGVLAIVERLGDFRGDSRFTTWAWKFSFYAASVAVRRRAWLGREVPVEAEGWDSLAREVGPDRSVEQAELLAAVKQGVEEALTPHQREVFVALALNQVPVDVLAERLGTTRGDLYKTVHDARERLRAYLEEKGLLPEGWEQARPRPRLSRRGRSRRA